MRRFSQIPTLPNSFIFHLSRDSYEMFFFFFPQELLTRHKILSAEFLEVNYDKVFSHYQRLLNSENYVTRRQSLKLLGELLLDRHNFTVSLFFPNEILRFFLIVPDRSNVILMCENLIISSGHDPVHIESR